MALPVLAWVALVPLLLALECRLQRSPSLRGSFTLGATGGFVFFLTGTHWLALLNPIALTVPWIRYVAWVLASGYLALFWGLAALFAAWLARRSGVSVRWTFVVAMLLVEELRGSGEMGFPWFQPGYTQHTLASALTLASLGSVTLVTLWVLLVNATLAACARSRDPRGDLQSALILVSGLWLDPTAWQRRREAAPFLLAMALLIAPWLQPGVWAPKARAVPPASVLLVQGNIPGDIKWSGRHQEEILSRFLSLSDSAARSAPGAALIVWPETATGSYLRKQVDQSLRVAALASKSGMPVLSGYADYSFTPEGKPLPWNAASIWHTDGRLGEVYAKRHLVPFGERIPFQRWIPALGRLDFGQAEWMPGLHTVLFDGPGGPMSTLICFESIFPDLARADVRAGARVLVNITNDEWFGNSAALYQHAAMAPFRAAENGVPLLRCANTGLTMVVDARGRVMQKAPVFESTVLHAEIPPALPTTPYTRLGDWPGLLGVIVAIGLALRLPGRR